MAHIGTSPGEVAAGESSSIAFRVGHGCDDSPTVSVVMEIPAGVTSVVPKAKPGMDGRNRRGCASRAGRGRRGERFPKAWFGSHGPAGLSTLTSTTSSRSGHKCPSTEGETIYFPVVQTCEEGEHAWIQIPEEGGPEAESPTPGVTLVASTGSDDHGSSETEEERARR